MSILNIDEYIYDPLFNEIWEAWPQSWGPGSGLWGETHVRNFSSKLMGALSQRGGYFHDAICQAVVTVWIRGVIVPQEEFNKAKELAKELANIVRSIEPNAKYIRIEYESTISGGDHCLPGIRIDFDSEWFGRDYRTDKYGAWHERHSTGTVHVWWNTKNIKGYQNSKQDARPAPRYDELYPTCRMWPKTNSFMGGIQRDAENHIFFPDGERYVYYDKK